MIFVKLISTKLILIVFELLLQMENKSFWLKINWGNTILQEFRHGNIIFIKQKWKEQKWPFCVINCEPFYQCGCFFFWDFIIKYVKFKQEKKEKHNFVRKHFMENYFPWNKKKWTVSDVNREQFRKCECFASEILLLNMLISKVEKLKKHNSAWISKGK